MLAIKVLGSGCANCRRLTDLAEQALAELGLPADVEKVTAPAEIASYGVMSTPALVVGDDVLLSGRIPALSSLRAALAGRLAAGEPPSGLHIASTGPPSALASIGMHQSSKTKEST